MKYCIEDGVEYKIQNVCKFCKNCARDTFSGQYYCNNVNVFRLWLLGPQPVSPFDQCEKFVMHEKYTDVKKCGLKDTLVKCNTVNANCRCFGCSDKDCSTCSYYGELLLNDKCCNVVMKMCDECMKKCR